MTVVAVVLLPFVLAYQAWTYYIFRRRVSADEFKAPPVPSPRETTDREERHVRQG